MTAEETAALTDAMVRSGVRVDYPGLAARRRRQAQHRRGRRQDVAHPGAAGGGLRRARADDVGPRPRPHRRDARQARIDSRASGPGCRSTSCGGRWPTIGCALIGQTSEVAPADRKLYALRDVTGTVESIPAHHRVDHEQEDRRRHRRAGARREVRRRRVHEDRGGRARARRSRSSTTGELAGVRTEALLTGMDAPLGRAVGNALEIIESIETLKGRGPAELESLSVEFAARMLVLERHRARRRRARRRAVRAALASGAGVEKFREIIAQPGGRPAGHRRLCPAAGRSRPRRLRRAARRVRRRTMRAEAVGRAAVGLGAGRDRLDAVVDPAVGFMVVAPVGTPRQGAATRSSRFIIAHGHGLADARRLLEAAIEIARRSRAGGPRRWCSIAIQRKDRLMATTEHDSDRRDRVSSARSARPTSRGTSRSSASPRPAAAVCALAANLLNLPRLQPLTGLIVILAIAVLLLDQPARDRPAHRRLGARAPDPVRAHRAEDRRSASRSSSRWPR